MIKIKRCECPNLLKNKPLRAHYYNNQDVTDDLLNMQYDKCAYCEKLLDQEKEVDHYIPREDLIIEVDENGKKIYDWNRLNKWENLLYACRKCNGAKKKVSPFGKISGERVIIDPTEPNIDPEEYIDFIIENYHSVRIKVTVCEKDKKTLGKTTIDSLRLDTRKDHIGALLRKGIELENDFLKLLVNLKAGLRITHIECQQRLNEIDLSMKPNSPFTGFSRAFFKQRIKQFYQDEAPLLEEELGKPVELTITIPKGCQL